MAIVQPGTGEAPVIEDGLYEVTCIDTEELEMADEYSNGELRAKLKVKLQVHGTSDDEGNEIILDPLMNLKWSAGGKYPASTLFTYATALCGPQSGDVGFDTDDLKGKKAQAYIETEAEGKWPKVTKIVALKKGSARPPLKEALADAAAQVSAEVADKGLSDFWAATRKAGVTLDDVKLSSNDMFGKAPAELTPDERNELLDALQVPF